jgi:hypothetical protein
MLPIFIRHPSNAPLIDFAFNALIRKTEGKIGHVQCQFSNWLQHGYDHVAGSTLRQFPDEMLVGIQLGMFDNQSFCT